MSFSDKIKELLEKKGIKISDLSRMTDIPASTLYNAINRDFKKMDILHLSKIALALGVSMDYLVYDGASIISDLNGLTVISTDGDDPTPRQLDKEETESFLNEIMALNNEELKELRLMLQFLKYKKEVSAFGKKDKL